MGESDSSEGSLCVCIFLFITLSFVEGWIPNNKEWFQINTGDGEKKERNAETTLQTQPEQIVQNPCNGSFCSLIPLYPFHSVGNTWFGYTWGKIREGQDMYNF